MKKCLAILAAAVMAAAVLAGCSAPAQQQPADGGGDVVNPLKEYETTEELMEATGIDVQLPHAAEVVLAQSIDGKMNEIVFRGADGTEYTYRKAKADFPDVNGENDISGMYVEWKDVHEATTPDGLAVTVKTGNPENEGEGLAIWNDGSYKYAIWMSKDYDEGMLLAAADSVQ